MEIKDLGLKQSSVTECPACGEKIRIPLNVVFEPMPTDDPMYNRGLAPGIWNQMKYTVTVDPSAVWNHALGHLDVAVDVSRDQ